ncbi:hypothetical protein BDW60DRAFT_93585 [Aspergillus nidulans var. acristatus]
MTLPEPHITAESFFHKIPSPGVGSGSSSRSPSSPWPITIYFITGNPGLISYYHVFLSLLSKNIASSQLACHHGVHIVGHSLAGFELETAAVQNEDGRQIYDLEEQICFVQRRLRGNMWRLRADPTVSKHHHDLDPDAATETETSKPKVILIGHSVGTYIAMEILRRHRERQSTPSDDGDVEVDFEIAGGIMLFPTVLDIAKSPSGQKLTLLLRIIPQLALMVSLFAWVLTTVLPDVLLRSLVRCVMRSPPEDAVDATTRFLKSRWGVREALHMAADEMRTITSDKWSDDVWGVSRATHKNDAQLVSKPPTQLIFYFGRNDHWVAEKTREEILAARGGMRAGRGPRMVVCEESVPHAFCLRHNEIMARKVADMVQEVLG